MRATVRNISVILLLVAFLTPGFAHAQVGGWERLAVSQATGTGLFSMAWTLLANMFDKNGSMLDPSGQPTTTTTTTTGATDDGDNGSMLDPSGAPK